MRILVQTDIETHGNYCAERCPFFHYRTIYPKTSGQCFLFGTLLKTENDRPKRPLVCLQAEYARTLLETNR